MRPVFEAPEYYGAICTVNTADGIACQRREPALTWVTARRVLTAGRVTVQEMFMQRTRSSSHDRIVHEGWDAAVPGARLEAALEDSAGDPRYLRNAASSAEFYEIRHRCLPSRNRRWLRLSRNSVDRNESVVVMVALVRALRRKLQKKKGERSEPIELRWQLRYASDTTRK